MSELTKLSASRIKTAQTCSWTYWCNYKLKLPDAGNDGSSRGTICHNVFELLGDHHRDEFDKIVEDGTIWNTEVVATQVKKEAEELANQYQMKYFEASAKKDMGIAAFFEELMTQVYKKRFNAEPER